MKEKIYIAGKITGDPNYAEKFMAAAQAYEKMGYAVLNPAVLPTGMLPADYMRICFAMIDSADMVVYLPDYNRSAGALLELQYCHYTGKKTKAIPYVSLQPGSQCPCNGCKKVSDPGDCDNKQCDEWKKWFLSEWKRIFGTTGGTPECGT